MEKHEVRAAAGGAAVVGVAFGMARYAYGLPLPDMQAEFDLSEQLSGLVASATFVGYLIGLLGVPVLVARRGPRAPTSVGGALGCTMVALSPNPVVLAASAVLAGSAAGWVWAPYSDVLRAVAAPQHRPTLLAVVTTGTGVGLVGLGALGLLAPFVSWRLTWAGIAVAAALAATLNLRLVPALPPPDRDEAGAPLHLARLLVPLLYTVAYFVAITVYFTYASDAAEEAGLADWAPALVFALIGLGGLVAFWTGRMTAALGPGGVGRPASAWSVPPCAGSGSPPAHRWCSAPRWCSARDSWSGRRCWPSGPPTSSPNGPAPPSPSRSSWDRSPRS